MGCAQSSSSVSDGKKKTETYPASVDDLKTRLLDDYKSVQKRFGHPTYYKQNGYDLGPRYDGIDVYQSFYIGTAYADSKKVSVKEHHTSVCKETDIIQEVLILANLSHECLPELYEVFITDTSVFTVCSQMDSVRLSHLCDLRRNSNTATNLADARNIGKALMEAVDHCHKKNIIIRNLTAANICTRRTSGGFIVKIADFSLAVMNGSTDFLCDSHSFNWGQVPFMAPEALLGNPFTYSMDIWALGVLLFMMVTNTLPFTSDEDADLMNQITNAKYSYEPDSSVPTTVRYFINQFLVVNADSRISLKDAQKNPWINHN